VLEIGDRYISYVDQGAGEPVILIHGMPTWGYLYHRLLPLLTERHRVLVPDLLGFGFSDKSDRFDRSVARQTESLEVWMSRLGIDRANVVGHGLGGAVAMRLAIFAPERVLRLCVIDPVCYDSWPVAGTLQLAHPELRKRVSASALISVLKLGLRQGFATRPPDFVLEGLLAPYATEVGKLSLIRNAAALDTNATTELVPYFGQLHQPTLILWGEGDRFQSPRFGDRLAFDLPNARLVKMARARHFAMIERSDEVSEQLAMFLESVRPRIAAPTVLAEPPQLRAGPSEQRAES
jgi:pimeloyl-ACP methyl ester carboxylesterase